MNYTMDNQGEGEFGTYAALLTDEYGGEEIYGEEARIIKELLEVETLEEIIFTCDEDVADRDGYEQFQRIIKIIESSPELKEINSFGAYTLYELEGVRVVYHCDQIEILFIKGCDRKNFDEATSKI